MSWFEKNLSRDMVSRHIEQRGSFQKNPNERIEKYRLKDHTLDRPETFDSERDQ